MLTSQHCLPLPVRADPGPGLSFYLVCSCCGWHRGAVRSGENLPVLLTGIAELLREAAAVSTVLPALALCAQVPAGHQDGRPSSIPAGPAAELGSLATFPPGWLQLGQGKEFFPLKHQGVLGCAGAQNSLGRDADDGRAGALQGWSSFSPTFITLCVSLQFAMAHTKSQ